MRNAHTYRPSVAGIVLIAYGLLFGVYGVRVALEGAWGDGVGAAVAMVGLLVLAWRLDTD